MKIQFLEHAWLWCLGLAPPTSSRPPPLLLLYPATLSTAAAAATARSRATSKSHLPSPSPAPRPTGPVDDDPPRLNAPNLTRPHEPQQRSSPDLVRKREQRSPSPRQPGSFSRSASGALGERGRSTRRRRRRSGSTATTTDERRESSARSPVRRRSQQQSLDYRQGTSSWPCPLKLPHLTLSRRLSSYSSSRPCPKTTGSRTATRSVP